MPRRTVPIRIRLDAEDARALQSAEADGISPSDLVRRGLRTVAAQYYGPRSRRPPKGRLLVCTDPNLDRSPTSTASSVTDGTFPPAWDEERVRRLLAHYESQSEDEAVAEDETGAVAPKHTPLVVPDELVPINRELIKKHGT